jgi:hypothetical protein
VKGENMNTTKMTMLGLWLQGFQKIVYGEEDNWWYAEKTWEYDKTDFDRTSIKCFPYGPDILSLINKGVRELDIAEWLSANGINLSEVKNLVESNARLS